MSADKSEAVNHPSHYGGKNNPFEVIKIVFAMGWGPIFCKANALKYIMRSGAKASATEAEDLRKAAWYLTYLADSLTEPTDH